MNKAGHFLTAARDWSTNTGDDAMWLVDGTSNLTNANDGTVVQVATGKATPGADLQIDGVEGSLLQRGPSRLPSEHLSELQEKGFTVLDNVVDAEAVQRIKTNAIAELAAQTPDAETSDTRVGIANGISWSADVARAVTNPVALWLIRSYLCSDDIHFCHQPGVTVLRPAKALIGTFPESGWHSDYPYHPGVLESARWGDAEPLAVQYNVCIDEFRQDNAATQFLPYSREKRAFPPMEFNEGGTRMGEGVHRDVEQMVAASGSVLIYDARTWHRACEELNTSGADRVAILNAVARSWVRPMADKSPGSLSYLKSLTPQHLNDRERSDIESLCLRKTQDAPQGSASVVPRESVFVKQAEEETS